MSKILVGLSGGVDSAVSAWLLREQGHEVSCGYMINYLDEENPTCPTRVDLEEAKKVAEYLGLPFYTFDYREEYERRIVDYIYREYEIGHTPNPDVFCNNLVKFDLFLEEALSLGFDTIAMGHYARVQDDQLLKGVDPLKDQSYFLSRLSQFQLSHALFPIGDLEKSEVREIAKKAGLPNADRKDSQGLCFIGKVSMKEFLEKRFPKKPGNIHDQTGKVVGIHGGAYSYTIGQRKGIEIGGGPALFVTAKDTVANTITVGGEADLHLFTSYCVLVDWVGSDLTEGKKYNAKIRYRQADQECEIIIDKNIIKVIFNFPQRAIAIGQVCVIYIGDVVIGSGIIQ
ncbi:tRNA 2-thiouridine(34) synthase MnmA [Candidatus Gracilibacteria bacterium]|nr:tRNA 2-thiouridine(34) synthase MnmA [Candidatus Gracilibacteria bacterium]